jgi:hypothetical protein
VRALGLPGGGAKALIFHRAVPIWGLSRERVFVQKG